MSEWDEKVKVKQERYEAAVEELRVACEAYTLADNAHRLVEIRLRGEVYGAGSTWTGDGKNWTSTPWTSEQDPRIRARVIEIPELLESLGNVHAAYTRMNNAEAALVLAEPRHWLGD